MTMPGSAPFTPASNDPLVSTVGPRSVLVRSPKYQTARLGIAAYSLRVRWGIGRA
jgi:hypothetical protein